jgi:predicted metal-dependent hydrolase
MTNIKKIKFKDLEISICFKKIKNINLKINHFHEISMSVPIRIKENEIERFLNTKEEWILKTLDRFEKKNLDDFYYLGQKYELKHQHSESRTLTVEIINNNFLIHLHEGIPLKTKQRLLEKHLEEQLKLLVRDFFEKWEKSLGVSKKSLIIKKMKGKWGYCHTRNHDVCLNLDLIKKDLKFIDYVVLHELCHILVPNHGPEFKKLLNFHMPNWRIIDKEFSI